MALSISSAVHKIVVQRELGTVIIRSAASWLKAVKNIVHPRDGSSASAVAVSSGSSSKSSVAVAFVVTSTVHKVVIIRNGSAKILSSRKALSRFQAVRLRVPLDVVGWATAWACGCAETRERRQALAVSIVAGGIGLVSRERNTVTIRNAVGSRGRGSGVSDCEVWLLRWARVSNVSSVQIELNKVVVEAHASVVVLDDVQRSSDSQHSVHFGSDIDVHHVGLQITS
jgi:hypothetical protein